MKKLLPFSLCLSALLLLSCGKESGKNESGSNAGNSKTEIDVSQAKKILDEGKPLMLLDVRTPEEVSQGYIKGAVQINYNESGFTEKISKLDTSQLVIVYCAVGGRSAKATSQMVNLGFKDVHNMTGGIEAWKAAGFPVEK